MLNNKAGDLYEHYETEKVPLEVSSGTKLICHIFHIIKVILAVLSELLVLVTTFP